jgi:hypothetical protein
MPSRRLLLSYLVAPLALFLTPHRVAIGATGDIVMVDGWILRRSDLEWQR